MRSFFDIFGLKGQLISARWQGLGKRTRHGVSSALKGQLSENMVKLPLQGAGRFLDLLYPNAPLRLRWAELNWPFRPRVKSGTMIFFDNTQIFDIPLTGFQISVKSKYRHFVVGATIEVLERVKNYHKIK